MSATEIFSAAVRREFQFLIDEFGFVRTDDTKADKWGDLRHRYEVAGWYIAPVYNEYERAINLEFGTNDYVGKRFTFHMYLGLVDPRTYYQLGFGIANSDFDIEPLVHLYATALRKSGSAILARDMNVCQQMIQAMELGEGMCPSFSEQPGETKIVSRYV